MWDAQYINWGHTFDPIIAKEKDTFCISDPVNKFDISDHNFVHSVLI